MLVDSHCHLDFPDFKDELDGVVARARAAGLERLVTISTRVRRQPDLLAIADRFPDVFCSVPHRITPWIGLHRHADLVSACQHPGGGGDRRGGAAYPLTQQPACGAGKGILTHIAAARRLSAVGDHAGEADADVAKIRVDR
jgi:TatD DNase family protein